MVEVSQEQSDDLRSVGDVVRAHADSDDVRSGYQACGVEEGGVSSIT